MAVTISWIRAANVLRLETVDMDVEGKALVVVGGRNAQGKSSLLNSISMALGGAKLCPPEPVRRGQRRAQVSLRLKGVDTVGESVDLTVVREWTPNKGTRLTVSTGKGPLQGPQGVLDLMYNTLTFDPLQFFQLKPAQQAALLREMAGLKYDDLEGPKMTAYDTRTNVNRDIKRLEAQATALDEEIHQSSYRNLPEKEISSDDVMAQFAAAQEANLEIERTNMREAAYRNQLQEAQRSLEARRQERDELLSRLRVLEQEIKQTIPSRIQHFTDALQEIIRTRADPVSLEPIQAAMKDIEGKNARIRKVRERAALGNQVAAAKAEAQRLTDELAQIEEVRRLRLSQAKFPIPDLSADESGVVYRGIPLEQASQAEQLRISAAIGFALNPDLKVLLVRDGSLLDKENLALLAHMAEEAGGQLWVERVGTEDATVVIEDGRVVEADNQDAGPSEPE